MDSKIAIIETLTDDLSNEEVMKVKEACSEINAVIERYGELGLTALSILNLALAEKLEDEIKSSLQ